jgi:hypothetical protein
MSIDTDGMPVYKGGPDIAGVKDQGLATQSRQRLIINQDNGDWLSPCQSKVMMAKSAFS